MYRITVCLIRLACGTAFAAYQLPDERLADRHAATIGGAGVERVPVSMFQWWALRFGAGPAELGL